MLRFYILHSRTAQIIVMTTPVFDPENIPVAPIVEHALTITTNSQRSTDREDIEFGGALILACLHYYGGSMNEEDLEMAWNVCQNEINIGIQEIIDAVTSAPAA